MRPGLVFQPRPFGTRARRFPAPLFFVLLGALLFALPGDAAPLQAQTNQAPRPVELQGAGQLAGFPVTVGDFQRVLVLSYQPSERDYSVGYSWTDRDRPTASTIYIYAADEFQPETAQELEAHFRDTIATLAYQHPGAALLQETKAQVRQGDLVIDGWRAVLTLEAEFAGARRTLGSEIYLFKRDGYFVKFRHSYPLEDRERVQPDLIHLMETLGWADAEKAMATLANWSL